MMPLLLAQVALFSAFPLYFTFLDPLIRRASFFIYIALVLLIGGFFGNIYSLPITENINVSGGNLCYGAFMMSSVLFVLMERDLFILRHLVRLVVLVDLFTVLFSMSVGYTLSQTDAINPHGTSADLFNVSIPFIILGGVLIISELLILLYCFEKIKSLQWSFSVTVLAYIISFICVLCLDGILFPLIALGFSQLAIDIVIGGFPGKVLMAALFTLPILLFVSVRRQSFNHFLTAEPFKWSLLLTTSQKLMRELADKEYGLKQADTVFKNVKEGLAIVDKAGQIVRTNPAFNALLELPPKQALVGSQIDTLIQPLESTWNNVRSSSSWRGEVEFGSQKVKGLLTVSEAIHPQTQLADTFVYSLVNIDELKKTQAQLAHLARHDMLTGLANRRVLDEHLTQLSSHPATLIVVDLDHFKDVNDSYGHRAGDFVLSSVASRLNDALQQIDKPSRFICRTGGDEFAILLDDFAPSAIESITHLLQQALQPVLVLPQGSEIYISATLGVSSQFNGEQRDLLQEADTALYSAKHLRRGSVGFYEERLTSISQRKLLLSSRLKQALAANQLTVFYQPQYSASTQLLLGVEALVRWYDDELGSISPAEFIPIAEEMGMIDTLGEWVLLEACQQGKKWSEQLSSPIKVSVNVSTHQLRFGRFVETVKEALNITRFSPALLQLELTESALIEREQEVIPQLNALKALGVSLAIDDFGTGYSSLSYVATMPWDTLKIDRCFINLLPEDETQQKMTATIVQLAHNMNLKVIVEGVETREQLDYLTGLGCDVIQGFYFSQAIAADNICEKSPVGPTVN